MLDYVHFLTNSITNGEPYFFTPKVFDEIQINGKKYLRGKEPEEAKEIRTAKKFLKEAAESNGNVLSYNYLTRQEVEVYEGLSQFYIDSSLKKISSADLECLLTGAVLSETGNPTALISNDWGIRNCWREILIYLDSDFDRLGFFSRRVAFPYLNREE